MKALRCDNCQRYDIADVRWVHVELTGVIISWADPRDGWDLCGYKCVQEWAEKRKKID